MSITFIKKSGHWISSRDDGKVKDFPPSTPVQEVMEWLGEPTEIMWVK